jgi:hypothetical protein
MTIITKNSQVGGKIPLASDLIVGEIAVNTADGLLFTKHSDGVVKSVGANAATIAAQIATAVSTETSRATAAEELKADQATTYTKVESDARIQTVVGAAPAALDTLAEIATQLASDESAAAALVNTVSTKADKVTGKGLSTEDYTTAEKTKLAAVSGSNTGDQVLPTTLPASDVSAWAKAATKPVYTASEIGLDAVDNTADADKLVSGPTLAALGFKADVATTYTKVQTDAAVAAATPSFATLTGKPTTLAGYGITDASTGGASLTPSPIKTSAYTAVANDLVRVNTTAGAFSVTLPASPVDGTTVGFLDAYGTCATNNLTILPRASTTIAFDATNVILDIAGAYITMIYTSANANWSISW